MHYAGLLDTGLVMFGSQRERYDFSSFSIFLLSKVID